MKRYPEIQTVYLQDAVRNCGYRVLTIDLKSLGLRKNPNILQYPVNEWFFLPASDVEKGPGDWGGIWVTRTMGDAKKMMHYMREKHGKETRLFKAAVDKILYANSYRIKTNGIYLMEELHSRT